MPYELMLLCGPSTESTLSEVEWAQDMLSVSVANSLFEKTNPIFKRAELT